MNCNPIRGIATPALIATEMALVTVATAAIGKHASMVMQNSLKGNNRGPAEKFEKEISRLSPNERVAKVTEKARELAKKWLETK